MTPLTPSGSARRPAWLASPPPTTALEISSRRVAAVAIADQGSGLAVAGYGTAALPVGAVEPQLNGVNVHDPAALTAAIRTALDGLSPRPKRVALVLPDTVAKVSLIRFEKVPARVQDLEQLIRWQVRKAAPFHLEDAQLAWVPGIGLEGGGREYIVTVARRDVIAAYERACDAAGVYAGLVDLASFNLMNTVLATSPAAATDWLLVHVGDDYATLGVVRGHDLVFFRNRSEAGPDELADLVHQTAMYHEDRLGGGGFTRVVIAGAALRGAAEAELMRRLLEERLGAKVEPLDFRSSVPIRDRIAAGPDLLDSLAPGLGILLRERVA
ncbi:MAG: pilus assembly protein PilM [Vicinamibacterales bacterium]